MDDRLCGLILLSKSLLRIWLLIVKRCPEMV